MPSSRLQSPPSPFTIFRTDDKPLRFTGWKLADARLTDRNGENVTRVCLFKSQSDSYIWSWDRFEAMDDDDDEPDTEQLERADAIVISSRDPDTDGNRRDPDEVVRLTWQHRPGANGRVIEAATRAWHQAAEHDPAIAKNHYQEVE